MNEPIPLGFYHEFGRVARAVDSIRDHLGARDVQHKALTVHYLRTAHRLTATMELLPDVIDGSPQPDSAGLRTDGKWVWRNDLAHYVDRHNLELPHDFVANVVEQNGVPPAVSNEQHQAIIKSWFQTDSK